MGDERLREEKISGKRIFEGRILDLDVDWVRLPSGTETTREVVRHLGAVVVLPVCPDGRVGLVRQYRYPMAEVLMELPAGKLDPGETPAECAARELAEEIGWRAGQMHELGSFFTTPGFTDEVMHLFRATDLESVPPRPEADENIEAATFTLPEARDMLSRGDIREGKTLVALLLELQRRG